MLAMNESILEIIRVLQLTSPTEEAGAFASSTGADGAGLPGGLLPGTLAAKIYTAKDLIGQTGKLRTNITCTVMEFRRLYIYVVFEKRLKSHIKAFELHLLQDQRDCSLKINF